MTAKGRSLAGSAAVVGAVALVGAPAVWADSTPVGKLPPPSVTTMTTAKGLLVSVTLPTRSPSTGLVWRIARPLDTRVVRQVGEADVGPAVVLVFRVVGTGQTSITLALTRGDASPRAIQAVRYVVQST